MLLILIKQFRNDALIKSWFENPNNRKFYGDADWEELQQTLKKDIIESRLMFGVKNHPRFTIANADKIEELVGPDKVRQIVEDAS